MGTKNKSGANPNIYIMMSRFMLGLFLRGGLEDVVFLLAFAK